MLTGFSQPSDADADDIALWMPVTLTNKGDNDRIHADHIISCIGEAFEQLFSKESSAVLASLKNSGQCFHIARFNIDSKDFYDNLNATNNTENKPLWKRPIQGLREMCDVCESTIFDYHWVCNKCGFAVCTACHSGNPSNWLICSVTKQPHDTQVLMLTQIIPSDGQFQKNGV